MFPIPMRIAFHNLKIMTTITGDGQTTVTGDGQNNCPSSLFDLLLKKDEIKISNVV